MGRLNADAQVISGELVAGAKAQVSNARFSGDGKTLFAKELNQALAGITQFSVNASAQGPLLHPDIGLGSDLDRQLQAAFNKRIKEVKKNEEAKDRKKDRERETKETERGEQ